MESCCPCLYLHLLLLCWLSSSGSHIEVTAKERSIGRFRSEDVTIRTTEISLYLSNTDRESQDIQNQDITVEMLGE
jgi:hypothetical protein